MKTLISTHSSLDEHFIGNVFITDNGYQVVLEAHNFFATVPLSSLDEAEDLAEDFALLGDEYGL